VLDGLAASWRGCGLWRVKVRMAVEGVGVPQTRLAGSRVNALAKFFRFFKCPHKIFVDFQIAGLKAAELLPELLF
jgi:hypothetical protein